MTSIREWLHAIGLGELSEEFELHRIDLDAARHLTDAEFKELGLPIGPRLKLKAAIQALTEQQRATLGSEASLQTLPASSAAERRQLTVLFCDLVGSTELARRLDPEEYRELVRSYQRACAEVISRFEGHVAQYLGDGLLVYFGYPRAHEDDAQRAVRAGLGVVEAVSALRLPTGPLSVRAGVHTGVVVIGDVGSGTSHEQLALGDAPNVAARLQGLAQPNAVVLSEDTRKLTAGSFEYLDLGSHPLKGVSNPLHAWRALQPSLLESRFDVATGGLPAPMVGRDLEFAVLMHAWRRTTSGKGQSVMLCGEPGIGKSRILRALREKLVEDGVVPWEYQCSAYLINSALHPIIENLARVLRFEREDSSEQRMDKVQRVLEDYGRPVLDANLIGRLLSLPAEERYGALAMTAQKQKAETIRALNEIIEAAAKRRAALILFEDLQWADPTTLELLEALLARLDRLPVLLVGTYRPEFRSPWLGRSLVTALTLGRLDPEQTRAIVTRVTGGHALPEEIVEQIAAKTDGIPLFVEELTKTILESRLLELTDHAYQLSGPLPALAIPATLRDSLMARLDRLSPVKEVAQIGACIGREFQQDLLGHISVLSPMQLQEALNTLVASELMFRRGQAPDAIYVFKHALIQEAAYDSLLKVKRSELHAQIALALETRSPDTAATQPELIAYHYTAAEMPERAIPYWHKAGELAQQRVALHEAIAHLERGIGLVHRLPPSRTREECELGLRTTLGMAWMALRGYAFPLVGENLQRARELEHQLSIDGHSLPVLWGLWVYTHSIGHVREGLVWAEELLSQAQRESSEDMRLAGHSAAANACYCLGEFRRVVQHADTSLVHYDASRDRHVADLLNFDPKTTANICKALAEWALGFPDRAARISEEGVAHARVRGHPFSFGWALYFSATALDSWRGDAGVCAAKLDEFERVARDQRLAFFEQVVGPLFRAILLFTSDRPHEAKSWFAEAIPRWTGAGLGIRVPNLKTLHAETAALAGRRDEALSLVEEALEQIARPGWEEQYFLAEALRVKGWILHQSADLLSAEACFEKALDVARQQQARSWELRAATSYARLLKDLDRRKNALALLQPLYEWFTEGRATRDHVEAAALIADLE